MICLKLVEGFIDIITMHLIYFPQNLLELTHFFSYLEFRPYDNGKVIKVKHFEFFFNTRDAQTENGKQNYVICSKDFRIR